MMKKKSLVRISFYLLLFFLSILPFFRPINAQQIISNFPNPGETEGKTCNNVCQAIDLICTSVGTDDNASNGSMRHKTRLGVCVNQDSSCSYRMDDENPSNFNACGGYETWWTNCNCVLPVVTPAPTSPTTAPSTTVPPTTTSPISPVEIPKYSDIGGIPSSAEIGKWSSIGDIVSRLLTYVFPIAGVLTFIYLLFGGFNLIFALGDPEKIKKAQGQITNAIVGFLIIFAAYWIIQTLEIILGIQLL